MSKMVSKASHFAKAHGFEFLFAAAGLLRLYGLTHPLEEPHSWRQADTANYALDFFRYGLNPFKPMVCWLGSHAVLILEFPLYEAVVAGFYRFFGEQLIIARIITILFWAGSSFYLYRLIELLYGRTQAQLTTLVYSVLPLGLYYSRAVHIDFSAIFFAHGMAYHLIAGLRRESSKTLWIGAIFGVLGAVTKAPYVFPLYFPLLFVFASERSCRAGYFALLSPVVVFALWQAYVHKVNASAPDFSFIPGYFKFVNLWDWYFGPVSERLSTANWYFLFRRSLYEVTTPYGLVLLLCGLVLQIKNREGASFCVLWLVGVFCYVLLFFHLNVVHDYYQIPFLAVMSFFIARSILVFFELPFPRSETKRAIFPGVVLLLLAVYSWQFSTAAYYHVDWLRYEAGRVIRDSTGVEELVIVSIADTDPRDPRILYAARRHGFSICEADLNPGLSRKLSQQNAKYLAIVRRVGDASLQSNHFRKFDLTHDGKQIGVLYLVAL